jgi:hypothetical protein
MRHGFAIYFPSRISGLGGNGGFRGLDKIWAEERFLVDFALERVRAAAFGNQAWGLRISAMAPLTSLTMWINTMSATTTRPPNLITCH